MTIEETNITFLYPPAFDKEWKKCIVKQFGFNEETLNTKSSNSNNKKIYQITNLGKKKLQKEKERMLKQISLLDQIGG